jgi:hypothetical protein
VLEVQGGEHLFCEPPFGILALLKVDERGRGIVNLPHADQLIENPAF